MGSGVPPTVQINIPGMRFDYSLLNKPPVTLEFKGDLPFQRFNRAVRASKLVLRKANVQFVTSPLPKHSWHWKTQASLRAITPARNPIASPHRTAIPGAKQS